MFRKAEVANALPTSTSRFKSKAPLNLQVQEAMRRSASSEAQQTMNALLGLPPVYTRNEHLTPPRQKPAKCKRVGVKQEPRDEDFGSAWEEIDDLLKEEQLSPFKPTDLDMSDLLDFDPQCEQHESKPFRPRPKQDWHRPGRDIPPNLQHAKEDVLEPSQSRVWAISQYPTANPFITSQADAKHVKSGHGDGRVEQRDMAQIIQVSPLQPETKKLQFPTVQQISQMDAQVVPDDFMKQFRALCRTRKITFPNQSPTWLELKQFVAQNPFIVLPPQRSNEEQINPGLESRDVSRQGLGQRKFLKPRSTARQAPLEQNSSSPFTPYQADSSAQGVPTSSTTSLPTTDVVIKSEDDAFGSRLDSREFHQDLSDSTQLQVKPEIAYLDDFPSLLPVDAPAGHPHLIPIADNSTLDNPLQEASSLNLPDVVVSILFHYGTPSQDILTAFLDTNHTTHFFFIFKSRTDRWHSWSIEREKDTVTIGIERNTRPHNDTSTSPSNGQNDLYVQYHLKIHPTFSSPRFVFDNGLMPTAPTPHDFLFSTSSTRGADQHREYSWLHRQLSEGIAALARYMQHSAFRASAMQAEFQVAYGRKVRYDKVIGSVRVVYDYALKGARTQALKRARGEYNRPVVLEDKPKDTGSKRRREGSGNAGASDEDGLF